ncbi:RNA-directed DNA polymerase, eukaryota [Tanacetum coccineum]
MAQKAKIWWAIEGDGNSKFFHGIINKKRSQLAIHGVLADGDWSVEPSLDLERNVSYEEIKRAVWDCEISKSPGPDGFTFKFYRKYWNLIDHDVVAAVTSFFSAGSFPPGCNSSFITLIPKSQEAKMVKDFRPISLIGSMYKIITKVLANRLSLVISELVSDVQSAFVSNRHILDGPFILNELLSWCKHKKSKALIFKIDFEKAFDSVRWDYLDVVLANFGFGLKWRSWIQGCLNSAMGSILVNGSPTSEFKFSKGLKQGDPLSPFLFIMIMESLHLSFNNVVNAGLYKGIQIDESLNLSHLFYADDINLNKSKLMGIGISHDVVASATKSIGCSILHTPFNYLGVKVGGIMSRLSSWDDSPLKQTYPRLYFLELDKHVSVASKLRANSLISSFRRSPRSGIEEEQLLLLISNTSSVILPNISDRWSWLLDPSGDFLVKSTREIIDDSMLPKTDVPTRWVKSIPIKINIFAWRVSLDKLPTRLNLSLRGLDIPSIICPLCSIVVESTSHLLFSCQLAHQLMIKVVHWWELEYQDFHSYEDWLFLFTNLRVSKRLKDVFEGVCYISNEWYEPELFSLFENEKQATKALVCKHATALGDSMIRICPTPSEVLPPCNLEMLKYFNTRACQLVLGAGAMLRNSNAIKTANVECRVQEPHQQREIESNALKKLEKGVYECYP